MLNTLIIIAIVFGVIALLGIVGLTVHSIKVKRETDANVVRVSAMIDRCMNEFSEKGVSSISKDKTAESLLPKNEILYGQFGSEITKLRYTQSGIKGTVEGNGLTLISDKAITIVAPSLKSGKRRYLYKNFVDSKPIAARTRVGEQISFTYNNKTLIVAPSDFKGFIMAFHLANNPIKDENSLTF